MALDLQPLDDTKAPSGLDLQPYEEPPISSAQISPDDAATLSRVRADLPTYHENLTPTEVSDAASVAKAAAGATLFGPSYFQQRMEAPSQAPTTADAVTAASVNVGRRAGIGLAQTAPLFAAAGPFPLLARGLAAYLTYKGVTQSLPQEYEQALDAHYNDDPQQKIEAYSELGLDGLFTLAMAGQAGKSGIARELPYIQEALTKKVQTEYSPAELKDIYTRVSTGGGTETEQTLVKNLNQTFGKPMQAIRQGVTATTSEPRFQNEALNKYLGVESGKPTLDLQPLAPEAGAEPLPIAVPQRTTSVLRRGLRLPAPPMETINENVTPENQVPQASAPVTQPLESAVPAPAVEAEAGAAPVQGDNQAVAAPQPAPQPPIQLPAPPAPAAEAKPKEAIIAAALKDPKTGEIWTAISHPQALLQVPDSKSRKLESGFVTDAGRYITRDESKKITGKRTATAQSIFGNFVDEAEMKRAVNAAQLVQKPVAETPKSSTQLTLKPADAAPFKAFAQSIPDSQVYHKADASGVEDFGIETEPHITALYGLTKHEAAPIQQVLAKHGPITVKLGKISVFKGEDYDVLKVDVSSPQLTALNKDLQKLPNENKFPEYKPHLTLAYLKKGEGEKYVGDKRFQGQTLTFDTVTFSPPKELRPQLGRPELPLAAQPPAPDLDALKQQLADLKARGKTKGLQYDRLRKQVQKLETERKAAAAVARAGAAEFKKLVLEYGMPFGWLKPDYTPFQSGKKLPVHQGLGSIGVKAKLLAAEREREAVAAAKHELGGDAADSRAEASAVLLPKLKAKIAQWNEQQLEAEHEAAMREEPPADADTSFLPPEEEAAVEKSKPKGKIPTLLEFTKAQVAKRSPKLAAQLTDESQVQNYRAQYEREYKQTPNLVPESEQPFNLAGEVVPDEARIAAEKAKAEADAVEAQRIQEQQQGKLFGEQAPKPEAPNVPPGTEGFFSDARAEELKRRIREKLRNITAGVDPTIFSDAVQLGAHYIVKGFHRFGDWVGQMREAFGDLFDDKKLRSIYETARVTIESPSGESSKGRPPGLQPGLRPPSERIVTARPEFTHPADESIIPPELVAHLDPHQKQGVATALKSLNERGGFLLADGTGAGKTRQAISVASYYAKLGRKVIIVTKAETIKPDWANNTFGGSYGFDSQQMGVPVKLARNGIVQPGEIGVTTYQNLAAVARAADPNTMLIFDESHALKNDSQQAKLGMLAISKSKGVMFMSATPADKPEHLYYLAPIGVQEGKSTQQMLQDLGMKLVTIEKMVKNENTGQWQKRKVTFWTEDQRVSDTERNKRFSELFDRMTAKGAMLKREISMDGVHMQVLKVSLPPEAHAVQNDILKFFDANTIDDLKGLKKATVLGHQRRQQEPYKIASTVILAQRELAQGRQVVIFVSRVNASEVGKWVKVQGMPGMEPERIREVLMSSEGTAKSLREALEDAGIHDIAEIHGNAEQKSLDAMADFQAGRKRVVIATIESGGTGINLDDVIGNKPRSMIVVTAPFDAVGNVQAAGRIWRLKTMSGSSLYYLFGDTPVDDWNASIIGSKMAHLGAVVEGQVRRLDISNPDAVTTDDYHEKVGEIQQPETPVSPTQIPTLDWKPFKTRAGADKFVADATPEFWNWWKANGERNNGQGLSVSKWQGKWQVWSNTNPQQPPRLSVSEPFYSRLTRAVEAVQQQKATGAQWKAMIKNSKMGVNKDEFDLVGIGDLEDGRSYTKQEVLDYLKANEVVVKDVKLGGNAKKVTMVRFKTLNEAQKDSVPGYEYMRPNDWVALVDGYPEGTAEGRLSEEKALNQINEDRGGAEMAEAGADTHFSTYQLPGGKQGSYREVLLTVPEKYLNLPEGWSVDSNEEGRWFVYNNDFKVEGSGRTLNEAVADVLPIGTIKGFKANPNWNDGHAQYSDIQNPIVRLRFNERTLPDGRRMLFLEEVQAPQKGQFENMPALFQKNWREIGFKWALRYAAEHGFDAVGWTTGEQQAERYDLSKHINGIVWMDNGDLYIRKVGEKDYQVEPIATGVSADNLEKYVGKDAAEKLANIESKTVTNGDGDDFVVRELTGHELKVGGEGLKRLYDIDFKNTVNNLPVVKKSGQKVGVENISGIRQPYEVWYEPDNGQRRFIQDFPTRDAAEKFVLKEGFGHVIQYNASELHRVAKSFSDNVHSINITPEMRDSIMRGQPLFAQGVERPSGLPLTTVQTHVTKIIAPYAPEVTVVQKQTDLPFDLQQYMKRDGISFVDGVWWNGRVWMVADNIKSVADAEAVLTHELFHGAIQDVLQNEFDDFMEGTLRKFQGSPELERIKALYLRGADPATRDERLEAGEELLAKIAENPTSNPSLWQRIVAWVRSVLRKIGFVKDVTDADIADLLRKTSQHFQQPNVTTGFRRTPRFSRIDAENMEQATALLRDPVPEEKPLIEALVKLPNDALFAHTLPAFDALTPLAKSKLPEMQERAQMMQQFGLTNDPRPLLERLKEQFPNDTDAVLTGMASMFYNAERFRANGEVLQRNLTDIMDVMRDKLAEKEKLTAETVKVDAARGLAQQMIEGANNQIDQRIAAERNDAERVTLENLRKLVDNFLPTDRMASILERAAKLAPADLKALETLIIDPTTTVQQVKAKYKIFDGVSDEVAQQALGVMRLDKTLGQRLLTVRAAADPKLASDLLTLNQKGQWDVRQFMQRYAELRQVSTDHARLLDAVTNDLRKYTRQYTALTSAKDFVDQTLASAPFQQNWGDAVRSAGAVTVIKTDNGLETVYKNPNVPESTETITIPTALDHRTAVANSAKLAQLSGWMLQYLETGTDPLLKASYEEDLNRINEILQNRLVNPMVGGRLTRAPLADWPFQLGSGFGRLSTPDTIGRLLGGELGMRVRMAVHNFSEVHSRIMNQFAELSNAIQIKVAAATKLHKMLTKNGAPDIDQWTRQVSQPILESYMAVGDRHLAEGDSLPGGITVKPEDMAAVAAQSRFIQKVMGDIQKLPEELRSFLFSPSRIVTVSKPVKEGGRVVMRNPIPLTKHGVPRTLSMAARAVAEKWQAVAKNDKLTPAQKIEQQVAMINDPANRDMFLSYFRTFSDPSFIVKSQLRDAALAVSRDINLGDVPASFSDWLDRLQVKEAERGRILSLAEVQALVLKDLGQVMAAVDAEKQPRDTSPHAPKLDIVDVENFMNRPRGDTIGLKGMYDLTMTNVGQQMQRAAQVEQVYGQEMLNAWRSALEGLRIKKEEFERQFKAGKTRSEVNKSTESALRSGEEWYKLAELDDLMAEISRNIRQVQDKKQNLAKFESQALVPRGLQLVRGYVLPGLLMTPAVMANNFFGGVMKLNQMDLMYGLTRAPFGVETSLIKLPVSFTSNLAKATQNVLKAVADGISAFALDTAAGKQALANMQEHPELYKNLTGWTLRKMEKWSKRYNDLENLGIYNYAPFLSQIEKRVKLWRLGGEIRGNNPTETLRRLSILANAFDLVFETGALLGRLPSAIFPAVVDAGINLTAFEKAQEALGVLQLNILKAFKVRVAAREDPATIVLTPQEFLGKPRTTNMEREFNHLQNLFSENGINLDMAARNYWREVQAAPTNKKGEVWMLDNTGVNSVGQTVANELNRAGFANRPQNLANDSWGRFFMSLLGYGINEGRKLMLALAKAARNPRKFSEIHTSLVFTLPLLFTILAFGTFISAPLIDKISELILKKKRARPQLSDAETLGDVLKVVGYAAGPLLPTVGQYVNTMLQPGAPSRGGLVGGLIQLLPLSLANSFSQMIHQMMDTGEIVRPFLQFNSQWNPTSNAVINRTSYMEGWVQMQNDISVQRKHTPGSIEMKKQSGGAPAQYSPVWGQIQTIKNELGKQNPDQAVIDAARNEGIQKLADKGTVDPAKSFDRALIASSNKYLNIYGRELTQAEKDKIDSKKTPDELAESNRIDANVQQYAQQYGEPVPDFIRITKDERTENKALGITSTTTRSISLTAPESNQSGASLGLSSSAVGGGRTGGGGAGGAGGAGQGGGAGGRESTGGGSTGALPRLSGGRIPGGHLRGGSGLRRLAASPRLRGGTGHVSKLRGPRQHKSKLRRVHV